MKNLKIFVAAFIGIITFSMQGFACGGMVFTGSLLCSPSSGYSSSPVSLGVMWVPTRLLGGGTTLKYPPQLSGATTTPSTSPTPATYPGYGMGMGYPSYGTGMGYPSYGMGMGYPSYGMGMSYPSYGMGMSYPSYGMGMSYPGYGMGTGYPSYGLGSFSLPSSGCSALSNFGLASFGFPSTCGMNSLASFGLGNMGYGSSLGYGSPLGCGGGMTSLYPSFGGIGSGCGSSVSPWGSTPGAPTLVVGTGYPGYGSGTYGTGYPGYVTTPVTTLPVGPPVSLCGGGYSTHSSCANSNPYATQPVYSTPRVVCVQCGLARNLLRPVMRARSLKSQRFY